VKQSDVKCKDLKHDDKLSKSGNKNEERSEDLWWNVCIIIDL